MIEAGIALDRARTALAGLDKEERIKLGGILADIFVALHSDLLPAIHEQHPDLAPPPKEEQREAARIDSALRWEDVRLPSSLSESDIDAILFSNMGPHWKKVAMVVGGSLDRCKELGIEMSAEMLAARIQALAEAERIKDIGDLRRWRFSEIRLKD